MRTFRVFRFAPVLVLLALVSWNCYKGGGEDLPNAPPITRLANIPPDSIVSDNPRMTLYWVGDDPDGFVVGYRYRWSFKASESAPVEEKPWTYLLNIGIDKSGGQKFALMTSAIASQLPAVYKFFATLPPEGIAADSANKLDAGDSLLIEGSWVWASNPDHADPPVRFPVHVNPNAGTFIFDSQDTLNPHVFTVQAIDDNGALDTTIRFASGQTSGNSVYFVTPQVPPPDVEVVTFPLDTVITLDRTTDTYQGAAFVFRGVDPNSRTIDYSWVVDRDIWLQDSGYIPWSAFNSSPSARVTAASFPPSVKFVTKHTLYVRARNEFGTISADSFVTQNGVVYSHRDFYTVYPRYAPPFNEHRILLLNVSYSDTVVTTATYPTADSLDAYYRSIMSAIGKDGQYDLIRARRIPAPEYFPGLGVLSHYSAVFIYADVINFASKSTARPFNEAEITEYVSTGGNLVYTAYDAPFERTATFLDFVCHWEVPPTVNRSHLLDTAFVGAPGRAGYPDIYLDPAKLDPAWNGRLFYIWPGRPTGFGEKISLFDQDPEPPNPFDSYEGLTVGTRYDGLTYKVIYFGFPLYYCQKPAVTAALAKAFQDIGE